jgi:glutamine synthetase
MNKIQENRNHAQFDYVFRTVEERGVRLIRLWFTDVLGRHKSVAISPAELETVFEEGLQFDGSAIDGFSRIQESDVLARPDPSTFELLPWVANDEASGTMFCNITNLDGTPFAGDPRQVLRRNIDIARETGYEMFCAPEIEFFYFANQENDIKPIPLDQASYFDLTTMDVASDLRRHTLHMLEALSIPVEYSFHEDSPSQHEIDLQYTDALTMADSVMTLRLAVKKIAMDRGVYATFMPKPLNGVQGSGMHTHLSLFSEGKNVFHEESGSLSPTGQSFVAGLLHHAREITAVTNQLVNSYKRINEGYEAPRYISWARNNRSSLVRIPTHKQDKPDSARIEYRAIDPACNPYLAFSVMLAAGLKGIKESYDLPPEATTNLYELSRAEQKKLGVDSLPANLSEALDEMEESDLVRETLGDHIFEWFLRNKRTEWNEYQRQVTPFEIEQYLPNW